MSNEKSALDLFNSYADFALTDDELLSIHGGATNGGGGSDSGGFGGLDSGPSIEHVPPGLPVGGDPGIGGGGGGGHIGLPAPPDVVRTIESIERGIEKVPDIVRDAGEWLLEKGADTAIRIMDASRLLKTPILIDHVVPPKPQA